MKKVQSISHRFYIKVYDRAHSITEVKIWNKIYYQLHKQVSDEVYFLVGKSHDQIYNRIKSQVGNEITNWCYRNCKNKKSLRLKY